MYNKYIDKYTAWCTDYWRRSARPEGGGGGSQRSQISLQSRPEYIKMAGFLHYWLKYRKKRRFLIKST